jgi:putative addiction module component (TIGR02574 family)
MNDQVRRLTQEARRLPPAERAQLIENLLASLDEPDARIDAAWVEEAERRLQLVDNGEMPVRDAAAVFAEIRKQRQAR